MKTAIVLLSLFCALAYAWVIWIMLAGYRDWLRQEANPGEHYRTIGARSSKARRRKGWA